MGLFSRVRSAITGRYVTRNAAIAYPETTVQETTWAPSINRCIDIQRAAEALVRSAGDVEPDGRVTVENVELQRLREAIGLKP